MATLAFNLSNRIDESGRSELHIRFCASRQQIYRIKSAFYITPNRWSKKNEISIPKLETKERAQLISLDAKLKSLSKHILTSFEHSDKTLVDKSWLLQCVDSFHFPEKYVEKEQDFFEAFDEFLVKRKLSQWRQRAFRVVYRSLQRYELYRQKKDKKFVLELKSFDENVLIDLESFFRSEEIVYKQYPDIYETIKESRKPDERSQNTINDLFIKLRTFMLWCVKTGKKKTSPFVNFHIEESVYGTPYYISIAERNQIYAHDFSDRPRLEVQRDIFVFQCLVGCRIGDLYTLKKSNIINGAVEYVASKTKDGNPITVRVPLNSIALEILEKYKTDERLELLPFISDQKYNKAIKKFFTLSGVTRIVTILNPRTRRPEQLPINEIASSHLARRCFVGNLYKIVRDPNIVGSLSGHKDGSKAFARYREIDDEIKTDLLNQLL